MTAGLTVTYGSLVITGTDGAGVNWYVFDPIAGWDGSPASTLALTQKPRGAGAFIGNTPQMASRVLVINGSIDAPTNNALQTALDQLVNAVTLGGQTLTVVRGSTSRYLTVLRQDEVLINEQHATLADFSIQCVAPDPRKLGDATGSLDGA